MTPNVERKQAKLAALLDATVAAVLANCLDITAIWSIGHDVDPARGEPVNSRLLAFGNETALKRLRKCDGMHSAELQVFVVVDGDNFFAASSASISPGSLARWGWRQGSPREAFYDECRWSPGDARNATVVRVRRRAVLIWPSFGRAQQ